MDTQPRILKLLKSFVDLSLLSFKDLHPEKTDLTTEKMLSHKAKVLRPARFMLEADIHGSKFLQRETISASCSCDLSSFSRFVQCFLMIYTC